jgi:hypothetical protein
MADVGRPTVMTDETLGKLREAFLLGCTDEEACLFADIHPSTLYDYQKEHPGYTEEKAQLKQNPILLARTTVVKALSNDHDHALKFLERKKKDEFSPKQEVENNGSLTLNIVSYSDPSSQLPTQSVPASDTQSS